MAAAVFFTFLLLLILLFNTTYAMSTTSNNNVNMKSPPIIPRQILESRLRNSLWSLFAGDALASPTHWYYGGFPQIQRDYGPAGITGYTKPKLHLEGSILNKSDPNGGGRLKTSSASGSLFGFGRNNNNNDKKVTIIGDVINHGKLPYWSPTESYHYHATLQSGENTLEAQLVRVLLKSLVATNGSFSPSHFRQAYVDFMTTAGSHNDTYASTCHRMFFANMVFGGLDPKDCPDNDGHNVDAIDGLILPTVVVLAETVRRLKIDAGSGSVVLEEEAKNAVRTAAAQTASVTRSSKLLERVSEVWADIVMASLLAPTEEDFATSLTASARKLGLSPPRSDGRDQLTACYLSQSLPSALDMICKYTQQSTKLGGTGLMCWKALLANANVGGENVHRGSLLGAVLGARVVDENGSSLPAELKEGLHHKEEIGKEIDSFVATILGQNGDRRGDAKEEM